jgi:hypothetical protein
MPFCSSLAFFAAFALADWNYYGESWRWRINEQNTGLVGDLAPDCLIDRCSFRDLSADEGGAIRVNSYGDFRVQFCIFLRCHASSTGGAVWGDTRWIDLLSSCAVDCSSEMHGGVVYGQPEDDANSDIADDSFVSATTNNDGTLFFTEPHNFRLKRLNFTACRAGNTGSAFKVETESARLSVEYLLLLHLTGDTGIDSYCKTLPTVNHCNIYENSVNAEWGVLYCHKYGMNVESCIFFGNSRDIRMKETPSSEDRFRLRNCVFSGAFPPESEWVTLAEGNFDFSETASFVIVGVPAEPYCPTNSPTGSIRRSPFATPSADFVASFPFQDRRALFPAVVPIPSVPARPHLRSHFAIRAALAAAAPSLPLVFPLRAPSFRSNSDPTNAPLNPSLTPASSSTSPISLAPLAAGPTDGAATSAATAGLNGGADLERARSLSRCNRSIPACPSVPATPPTPDSRPRATVCD